MIVEQTTKELIRSLTPVDSIQDEFYSFDDLLAAKRITTSDVSFAIPRRNWTTKQFTIIIDMIMVIE